MASRRLALTVLVAVVAVVVASWVLAPRLSSDRNGDPRMPAQLTAQQQMGLLSGYHDLAVAEVDLDARASRSAGRPPR